MLLSLDSEAVVGMTLADFAAHRGKHRQSLRAEYRRLFRNEEALALPAITRRVDDPQDGTVKFCLPVAREKPGATMPAVYESESVIIPMTSFGGTSWFTLCLSSQIGCRMACSFCETGRMGLLQNLTAAQIVRQRLVARQVRGAAQKLVPGAVAMRGGGQTYFSDGIPRIKGIDLPPDVLRKIYRENARRLLPG